MPDARDASVVLGISFTRNRTKETVAITQDNFAKSMLER